MSNPTPKSLEVKVPIRRLCRGNRRCSLFFGRVFTLSKSLKSDLNSSRDVFLKVGFPIMLSHTLVTLKRL